MNRDDEPLAFPLQWPRGKARTDWSKRVRAPFHRVESIHHSSAVFGGSGWTQRSKREMTVAIAMSRLSGELERLGARRIVLSTNVELNQRGQPYSNRRAPDDPGVALYFYLKDEPYTLACDRYVTVADNITALAKHVEASRGIERWGVGTLHEIFRGFAALPPAMAPGDWREPLGNPQTLDEAEANYRARIKYAHPDINQSDAAGVIAAKLNAAIELARKYFGGYA